MTDLETEIKCPYLDKPIPPEKRPKKCGNCHTCKHDPARNAECSGFPDYLKHFIRKSSIPEIYIG